MPRGLIVIGVVISAKFALLHNGCEIERNDLSRRLLYIHARSKEKHLNEALSLVQKAGIERENDDALVLVNDFVSRCVCCECKRVQNSFF